MREPQCAMKTHILAIALLTSSWAYAQESRSETQAIRCAAVFFVLTSLSSTEPDFGREMKVSTRLFHSAFASRWNVRTGSSMTNGEISARRELVLAELRKSWKSNPEAVIVEAALCSSWLDSIGQRLASVKGEPSSEREFVRLVGEPPATATAEDLASLRILVPMAFEAWASLDFVTPASVRKQVEDSLRSK